MAQKSCGGLGTCATFSVNLLFSLFTLLRFLDVSSLFLSSESSRFPMGPKPDTPLPAFLSSLRTNLRLNASPPPSPMSTPPSMHASASFLPGGAPEPSPLVADMSILTPPHTPTNPLEGVPDLTTFTTTDDDEKIAALKLVSDSVAQMRQTASSILIYHPVNIGVFAVLLGLVCQRLYKDRSDTGIVFTTAAGITMAALIFVRWLTGGYIFAAEDYAKLAPEMLENADVIVTKFGDEVIGAVIMGWKGVEPGKGGSSPRDSQRGKRRKWRAEIKGWAVRIRYRGKGCGGDLLEEAVQLAKSKGAETVGFADDHASEWTCTLSLDVLMANFEVQTPSVSCGATTTPRSTSRR